MKVIAAAVVALVLAAVADAKLCVRIAAQSTAARGEPVQVTATTLMPSAWMDGRPVGLHPVAGSGPLRLVLEGPGGEYREVVLRRLAARPATVRATIRLGTAGTWRLTMLGWFHAPRACAPPRLIRVA